MHPNEKVGGGSQMASGDPAKKIIHAAVHHLEAFIFNNSQSIHSSWRYKYISFLFEHVLNNTAPDSGGSQYYCIFHPTSTPL